MAQNAPQPPAVANNHANALLDDAYYHGGAGNVNPATRVAQAWMRKRTAEELYLTTRSVTLEEVGQQQIFHFKETAKAANLAVPGLAHALVPFIAQPGTIVADANAQRETNMNRSIVQLLTNMTNNMAQANEQLETNMMNNMAQTLAPINAQLHNLNARQSNALVVARDDVLVPIHDDAGNAAPNFPATLNDLTNLTEQQQGQLLVFYGLPADATRQRIHRLQNLLGIHS